MLTLTRCRESVLIHGPSCLDYMRRDIQEALAMALSLDKAGMPSDRSRASEYADELCIIAQVRSETQGKPCCLTCGRVMP